MISLILHYLDPTYIIHTFGLRGISAVIFAESGLFFGALFPGDSLLFITGISVAGHLISENIILVIGIIACAAILGEMVGYYFGKFLGHYLHNLKDTFYFKKAYLTQAQEFFEKHGFKSIIIARFIPIVRTFVPIIAGMSEMEQGGFAKAAVLGGVLWTGLLIGGSYLAGKQFPQLGHHIDLIIIVIVFISFSPIIWAKLVSKK